MQLFEDLQASGIDFAAELIQGGWLVRVGNEFTEWIVEIQQPLKTWRDAEAWLIAAGCRLHPKSEFARKYGLMARPDNLPTTEIRGRVHGLN